MRSVTFPLTFNGETKPVTLNALTREEYDTAYDVNKVYEWSTLVNILWQLKLRVRSFTLGGVYVPEENLSDLKLIGHEIGHVFNLKHTLLPTTMNPSFIFRWFDREELVPLAEQLTQALSTPTHA